MSRAAELNAFLADVERRAFHMARGAVNDSDDALDLVQDSMFTLARRYGDRPSAEWPPLFFRILRNRITDHQRRRSLTRRLFLWRRSDDDDAADPLASAAAEAAWEPARQHDLDDRVERLQAVLATLPPRQQEAFTLRGLEGLSVAEAASAMGCSSGSVKTHYFRALESLKAQLAHIDEARADGAKADGKETDGESTDRGRDR